MHFLLMNTAQEQTLACRKMPHPFLQVGASFAVAVVVSYALLVVHVPVAAAAAAVDPAWDMVVDRPGNAHCVNASVSGAPFSENNSRWTWLALPEGPAPAGGWPVYAAFVPWVRRPSLSQVQYTNKHNKTHNRTCGNGWSMYPQAAPSCMAYMKHVCNMSATPKPKGTCAKCAADARTKDNAHYLAAKCNKPQEEVWCVYGGKTKSMYIEKPFPIFQRPGEVALGCFNKDGAYNETVCHTRQDAMTGMIWSQRLNQYLLANGIALLYINPWLEDNWDWSPSDSSLNIPSQQAWDTGLDKPFMRKLLTEIHSGQYAGLGKGVLDLGKLMVWGYSTGAQMVSWMMQLHGSGQLQRLGGGGQAKVVAGVMFAGGSYGCFLDPPLSAAQCRNCNASASCNTLGCSNKMAVPCCNYCCPQHFTEQWYLDHPQDYATHPPVFLVQHTTVDVGSDTCAALNYHETMQAHGGRSKMMLIPPNLEMCFCVGNQVSDYPATAQTADLPCTDQRLLLF